ncbi:MAG: FecCD family ABC transporter permease [Deltaproteobacteria bacterium]
MSSEARVALAPGMPPGAVEKLGAGRYSPARLARLVALGTALLFAVILLAALFGGVRLQLADALSGQGPDGVVFWSLRLPRVLLGGLVGAALCAAGAALQGLLQNPLAVPFVLGVSGGAAAGGTLAVLAAELFGLRLAGRFGLSPRVAFGFLGALASVAIVRALASRGGRLVGAAALLAGAVLNALAGALVLLAELALAPAKSQELLLWLAGSLGYPAPSQLWATLACVLASVGALAALSGRLELLSLGEEEAAQLGVDAVATSRAALAACALGVSAAVAVSGLIGFVGLLVPHLLGLWLGPDRRLIVPLSALFGASFLIAADAAGRLCFLPLGIEAPVGALTALLGGPLFLWLLRAELGAR